MTKAKAIADFKKFILPYLDRTDKVSLRTEWGAYTDKLCRGRSITIEQYSSWTNPYE